MTIHSRHEESLHPWLSKICPVKTDQTSQADLNLHLVYMSKDMFSDIVVQIMISTKQGIIFRILNKTRKIFHNEIFIQLFSRKHIYVS